MGDTDAAPDSDTLYKVHWSGTPPPPRSSFQSPTLSPNPQLSWSVIEPFLHAFVELPSTMWSCFSGPEPASRLLQCDCPSSGSGDDQSSIPAASHSVGSL